MKGNSTHLLSPQNLLHQPRPLTSKFLLVKLNTVMLELASHNLAMIAKHLVSLARQAREEHGSQPRCLDTLHVNAAAPTSSAADVAHIESVIAALEAVADDGMCWHFSVQPVV
jgi:hypothetical protein